MSTEPEPETTELLNDELRARLDTQRAAFTQLESRAAIVLGACFAAVQFVAGQDQQSGWLPWALGSYGLAGACSLIAVWPRRFEELKPRSVVVGLWLWPRGRAAAELANNRLAIFERNVDRQAWLVRLVRASVVLALAGAIMSVIHLTEEGTSDGGRREPAACTSVPGASTSDEC